MASYLVHYVAKTSDHDYERLQSALEHLEAVQLTEELWLVESDVGQQQLTKDLFTDRPPTDRFFLLELPPSPAWSAANLMSDPLAAFATIAAGRRSVMLFRPGEPPKKVRPHRPHASA